MSAETLPLFDGPPPVDVRRRHAPRRADPLDGLPPSLDLMAAAALLGIGRTCAYGLVRRGEWPTPVIRVGRCIRIPTAPLVELLRDPHGGFPQTAARSAVGGRSG
jgi:hypothetical protein